MVKMENINHRELLTAYIQMRYPKQDSTRYVVTIVLDEIEFDSEREDLEYALEESGVPAGGYFMHPGILIVEMPSGLAMQLCNRFQKAGFTILVYRDGEIIHENR